MLDDGPRNLRRREFANRAISVNPRDLSTSLASLKGTPMTLGSVTIFGAIGVSETVDVALGGDEGP